MKNRERISFITKVSILAALAAVLAYVEFPLPIAPPFYKINFSNVPTMIAGLALGPAAAFATEALRTILNLLLKPTTTAYVGELSLFICNLAYVVPAAYYYKNNKTKKGAALALCIGSVTAVVVSALSNYFFIIPAYVKFYHLPLEAIIGMGQAIFGAISNKFTFVLMCTAPFNAVKVVLHSVIVMIIYKKISTLLKKY